MLQLQTVMCKDVFTTLHHSFAMSKENHLHCCLWVPPAAYTQLKTSVEKSDAWRYHILCGHGGVYADTDTICARSFESWTQFNTSPEPGLLVGIENRFHSQQAAEEASYVHKIQVTQWTMAAKKSHPVVCRMGAAIKAYVEEEAASGNAIEAEHGHDASILLRTGPGIWSKEVHSYLRQMGSSPEDVAEGGQVEDIVVLPQVAFGCNFRYWTETNNASMVFHMFNNSWKVDHYKVADAKKLRRQEQERQATRRRHQALYVAGIGAAATGLGLALCSSWCLSCRSRVLGAVGFSYKGRLRRPYALVVGGSPKSSPKNSPLGSPHCRGGSSSSSSVHSGRLTQQRHSALHLLNGTRKPARLVQ